MINVGTETAFRHDHRKHFQKKVNIFSFFYGCFYFALPIYSQSFAKSFYFSIEPSKEGSTENRNLLSARAAHNVQTLRALLSAMEALPQAPWSGKAARFIAKSSTPHLWAHV